MAELRARPGDDAAQAESGVPGERAEAEDDAHVGQQREFLLRPRQAGVALGGFAWRAVLDMVREAGGSVGRPMPKFGHGATAALQTPHGEVTLIGCYHPSQQNTFTGKLTPSMLDDVFGTAAALAGIAGRQE